MDKNQLLLVQKARKQNPKAFVELCELKAQYILYFCRQYMNNIQDAEDAAQEAFIRMQKDICKLSAPEAFNTWLNKLLIHTCINMRRKSMKDKGQLSIESVELDLVSDSLESLPQEYIEEANLRESIVEIVRGLPDKYKEYVLLHYYQNMTYAQIAEVLDVTPDVVQGKLRMARKYLKLELEDKVDSWKQEKLPMVDISTALFAIFNRSAKETVLPDIAQKCMEAAGVYTAFAASGAAGAAGTAGPFAMGSTAVLKGAAIAVTSIAVAASILFSSASEPLSANASEGMDPQPVSQMVVDSGYEDSASSALDDAYSPKGMSAPVQSNESVPGADVPSMIATSVGGTVYLKDNKGKLLRAMPEMVGKSVTLSDTGGNTLAKTHVDAKGHFIFESIGLNKSTEWVVALECRRPFTPAADNPNGKCTILVEPGKDARVDVYVQTMVTPEVKVMLEGTKPAGGIVNPEKIVIQNKGPLPITQSWRIVNTASGQTVATGTGSVIQEELSGLEDGCYTLECIVTDEVGNSVNIKCDFWIIDSVLAAGLFGL